jgi:hypothetical protein
MQGNVGLEIGVEVDAGLRAGGTGEEEDDDDEDEDDDEDVREGMGPRMVGRGGVGVGLLLARGSEAGVGWMVLRIKWSLLRRSADECCSA